MCSDFLDVLAHTQWDTAETDTVELILCPPVFYKRFIISV